MCGIAGHWSRQGASQVVIDEQIKQIHHRGPDEQGTLVKGDIALGSCRLAIIDLAGGRQPISNEDNTIHIVFNGEIYNYKDLRQELTGLGHTFRTTSDTEVILHGYEEYGEAIVQKLNGMFAFAIWSEKTGELFLARDPLGQKPLYYSMQDGHFVFASEVKSILQYPGFKAALNKRAMHQLISIRCVPGDKTLFEGISKLAAGHTLRLKNNELRTHRYWSLRFQPKWEGSEDEIVDRLRDLLQETVSDHMVSDVPIGAFLSGGIDSSLIVAMMSRHQAPVNTFAIGVQAAGFNELPFAREMANHCNTNHFEAVVGPDLVSTLPEMIHFMEEPVDPFAFGVYSASRLAAQHVKVVLGGDGGDEMFAGYDRYVGHRLVDLYCRLPSVLRRRMIEPLIERLPDGFRYNNMTQRLRWLAAMSEHEGGRRYAASACYLRFNQHRKQALYSPQLWNELGSEDPESDLLSLYESDNAEQVLDRMLFTDVDTRLADHLLMVGDRMTMAHGLEGRSPFVDRRVAEFAARIPAEMKIRGGNLKHMLRRAARGLIPESLIKRKKKGFGFPLANWFKTDLREMTLNLLLSGRMVSAGYFQPAAIKNTMHEHAQGQVDHNYRLWLLVNMELWFRHFIDGDSISSLKGSLEQELPAGYSGD